MKAILFLSISFSINCFGQTANDYYQRGKAKVQLGDYRGSIIDFSQALNLNPKDAKS